jgi:hypothetical protein
VSAYRLVYPDGNAVERDGEVPTVGYDVDGYRVDFVRHRGGGTVIFLGLHYGQAAVVKLAYVNVGGVPQPLTLAEAAELADRSRAISAGNVELPVHALAVRFEQLVEEGIELPEMDMSESEQTALRAVIAQWIADDGAEFVPERVRALLDAVERHTEAE